MRGLRFALVLLSIGALAPACGSNSASSSSGAGNENSSVDGTWTGTWLSRDGAGGDLTLVIDGATSSGVTGTVSFTDSPCFSSGAVAATLSGETLTGAVTAGSIDVSFAATITGTMMSGTFDTVSAGACTGTMGTISLTK